MMKWSLYSADSGAVWRCFKEEAVLIVQLTNINKIYQSKDGETQALKDVSLSIEKGEFISIVGPSGCGKSTLLSIIAGLEQPDGGEIFINGQRLEGITPQIGYMPQKDRLFEWRSIKGNVTLGLEIQKIKKGAHLKRTQELLERYGLSEFADKVPSQLSGGMRQRCALIRTLAADPEILLLDEPFSALDYQTRLSVSEDISNIIRQEQKTAILVTHDIAESVSLSDRVVVLSARPGTVRAIYDLSLFDGLSPMQRRDHESFHEFFNDIWKRMEHSV